MQNFSNVITRAKRILSANRYMVLATIQAGKPWSTPVFYAYDDHYNFYWYSRNGISLLLSRTEKPKAISISISDLAIDMWQAVGGNKDILEDKEIIGMLLPLHQLP